jgi:tetraacyldisaccharide 4'-kinase
MKKWLERQWYKKDASLFGLLMMPLDLLMALLVSIRILFYKIGFFSSWRSPVPAVIVGNVTVGGTGKTPLVLFLVDALKAKGYQPGIVSRGYGGSAQTGMAVTVESSASLVGDEPLLMAMRADCPVWIGRNRPAVVQALLAANPQCDVIISDDGLQHYALQRDIEIAVVDGVRLYGNGAMLPVGPMREPLWRINSVDAVVINGGKADYLADAYLMRLNGERFYQLNNPSKTATAADFKGKAVHALAGVGNPSRFFNHLSQLGLSVVKHPFSDHHQFTWADLQIEEAEVILMTEKDAVKCRQFNLCNAWVLPVQAEVIGGLEDKVIEKIESIYGRKTA